MISTSVLTTGNAGSGSSMTTGAISPAANTLIFLAVVTKIAASDPNIPTASGLGLTWTNQSSVLQTGSQHVRLTLFRATQSSPITPGTVVIDFAGQTQDDGCWIIIQVSGVKTTGTNGSDGIIQTNTSTAGSTTTTVSMSGFANPNNAALGFIGSLSLGTTYSPGSGFTTITSAAGSEEVVNAEIDPSANTSISWTQNSSTYPTAAIGLELAVLPNGGFFGIL